MLSGGFTTQLYGALETKWSHRFRAGARTQRECRGKYCPTAQNSMLSARHA